MFKIKRKQLKEKKVLNIDKNTKTRRSNRINIMMENDKENTTENVTENVSENATEIATKNAEVSVTVSSVERNSDSLMKNKIFQIGKTKVIEEICLPNVVC